MSDQLNPQPSETAVAPTTVDPSLAPPDSPDDVSQTFPNLPTFEKIAGPPAPEPRPLTLRQLTAIDLLLAAKTDAEIVKKLKIDRRTLYNWRHKNPLFIAELNRRSHAAWNETAQRLRALVTRALDTLSEQLGGLISDAGRTRAARTLIHLIVNQKLAPTGPTNLNEILDQFLDAAQPPKPNGSAATYSDTQRTQILHDLLTESADIDPPAPEGRENKAPGASPG
jgi:hypothetical protein